MEDIGLEIFEYSKPPSYYGEWEIDNSETIELLEHVTQIKRKRIQSLASIYRNGDFDIAHTLAGLVQYLWWDSGNYCRSK